MTKEMLAKKIYEHALSLGTFIQTSGQISSLYFDQYVFESDPELLVDIARHMSGLLPIDAELLAGIGMGGIPIATAISIATKKKITFVQREKKGYNTRQIAQGIDINGKKVCIIEDVITSSGQIIQGVRKLRERGAIVESVLCFIEQNERVKHLLKHEQLLLIPAFTMEELKKN